MIDTTQWPNYQERSRYYSTEGKSISFGLPPIPKPETALNLLTQNLLTQIALNQTQIVYAAIESKEIPTLISLADGLVKRCKENASVYGESQQFQQLIR